jgi:hypothetical protein
MVAQTDQLIMSAIGALDGPAEAEMVGHLLKLRDSLRDRAERAERDTDIEQVREAAMGAVNDYFFRMLTAVPDIKAYLDEVAAKTPA